MDFKNHPTLMDSFQEVIHDSPCHVRWNCTDFIADPFLQILI